MGSFASKSSPIHNKPSTDEDEAANVIRRRDEMEKRIFNIKNSRMLDIPNGYAYPPNRPTSETEQYCDKYTGMPHIPPGYAYPPNRSTSEAEQYRDKNSRMLNIPNGYAYPPNRSTSEAEQYRDKYTGISHIPPGYAYPPNRSTSEAEQYACDKYTGIPHIPPGYAYPPNNGSSTNEYSDSDDDNNNDSDGREVHVGNNAYGKGIMKDFLKEANIETNTEYHNDSLEQFLRDILGSSAFKSFLASNKPETDKYINILEFWQLCNTFKSTFNNEILLELVDLYIRPNSEKEIDFSMISKTNSNAMFAFIKLVCDDKGVLSNANTSTNTNVQKRKDLATSYLVIFKLQEEALSILSHALYLEFCESSFFKDMTDSIIEHSDTIIEDVEKRNSQPVKPFVSMMNLKIVEGVSEVVSGLPSCSLWVQVSAFSGLPGNCTICFFFV